LNSRLVKSFNKILCHHPAEKLDHCIRFIFFKKEIYLCARCLGLYPFAIIWLFISLKFKIKFNYDFEKRFILYLLFPAFLDWALSGLNVIKSNNKLRFLSGFIASFALSRWWFLWIEHYFIDIVIYIAKVYIIGIIVIWFLIYRINSKAFR